MNGSAIDNIEDIYKGETYNTGGRHFGSKIEFDNDGYLFFTIGDRGNRNSYLKIYQKMLVSYRLHDDGTVPVDNPFIAQESTIPAVWSYGHRNPKAWR